MRSVHVVVPEGIDDPRRPSGGNHYDRRLCDELTGLGWVVTAHAVAGAWPAADREARTALGRLLAGLPDGAVVLLDGLVATAAPAELVPAAARLRLVVLVHMPRGQGAAAVDEGAVLTAAAAVVTPSAWTRRLLLARHPLRADRVHVAEPGVDPAAVAPGTPDGGELLAVAAVAPHKGHALLLAALARVADRPWRCTCVGSLERDPAFVDRVRRRADAAGVGDRLRLTGPLVGAALDDAYARADVLVLASRQESYGMVATEALARGIPVLATDVGGLPEALRHAPGERRPGMLVPPDDPVALAGALRTWLDDTDERRQLREAAAGRRTTLPGWSTTAATVARVLDEVA